MSFVTINSASIEVGDALKAELFTQIKDNFDDHETRIQSLAAGTAKVSLINEDIYVGSTASALLTGVYYVEVLQACTVVEGSIQFFTVSPATSGTLSVDIKKNTSTNPSGFTSLFSSVPSMTIATGNYSRSTGTINTSYQSLSVGDILRVDVTGLPSGLQNFRVTLVGEL